MNDFTITLIGKSGRFSTHIYQEIDFITTPYEVCLQDLVFTPGSWGNVRVQTNYFIAHDQKSKTTKFLEIPIRNYNSVSDILAEINMAIKNGFGTGCDLFLYYDKSDSNSKIVLPVPWGNYNKSDPVPQVNYKKDPKIVIPIQNVKYATLQLLLHGELAFKKRFNKDQTVEVESINTLNIPNVVQFGGGLNTELMLTFCKELAIILGIVASQNFPSPTIMPGWSKKVKDMDMAKNNLRMLWIYGDFVGTTMLGEVRAPLIKYVPILDSSKSVTHSAFNLDNFVPVQKRRIQSFGITIQEGPNSSQPLQIDEQVILTLYFRPIQ
jgi:hypothetical protein